MGWGAWRTCSRKGGPLSGRASQSQSREQPGLGRGRQILQLTASPGRNPHPLAITHSSFPCATSQLLPLCPAAASQEARSDPESQVGIVINVTAHPSHTGCGLKTIIKLSSPSAHPRIPFYPLR